MKDDSINYLIRGIEVVGGAVLMFLSFTGRSLWNDYQELKKEVETVKDEQEKNKIRVTAKQAELISRIDAVENYSRNKFERLEELTDIRFKEIHKDLDTLKQGQDKTNELLAELLKK